MRPASIFVAPLALLLSALISTRCGSGQPVISPSAVNTTPPAAVSTTPTVTSVKVGVLGNAATAVAPGDSLQLWAQASYSDDTTVDVTNTAVWQSSDPALATISREGLLKAGSVEGTVEAKASMGQLSAALRADIRRRGCGTSTLSPARVIFSAFGNYQGNYQNATTVTTPSSDCRWTASSNADWLRLVGGNDRWKYDPGRSGSGSFLYTVLANNFPEPRSGNITVAFSDGSNVVHFVSQEAPSSCSYVVTPDEATFTRAGVHVGAFDLIVTPSSCRWTASSDSTNVVVTAGTSGTGSARFTYTVFPTAYAYDRSITIAGLSGTNPPGIHRIHITP